MIVHYYTIILILHYQKFSVFFLGYTSFSRYFSINCNIFFFICSSFRDFCKRVSNFFTNQITNFPAVFWIALFEEVLNASVAECLAWSIIFWLYLSLQVLPIYYYQYFYSFFSKRQKSVTLQILTWVELNSASFYILYFN